MSAGLDVVVPMYGHWELAAACLESLLGQEVAAPVRVVVVDDASPDDSAARVAERFPEVPVVVQPANRGFAATCNRGVAEGDGSVVVLVNTDVVAHPGLLAGLWAAFDDPAVGSVTPLVLDPDGRVDALGIAADPTRAGFLRRHGASPDTLDEPTWRLLGPYGAVAAYRREAWQQVGGLDEGIVMYGEELDLALRLSAAGWAAAQVPHAVATHLGGASAGRGSAAQRERSGFGRGYLLRAHGVLRGRYAPRALLTEAVVVVGDALAHRDLAAGRGRLRGWRAARTAARRRGPVPGIDPSIGFVRSLRLRLGPP